MNPPSPTKDPTDDERTILIVKALKGKDLTHDHVTALGETKHHAAVVMETLQATGLVESSCEPIQPSRCRYRLVEEGVRPRSQAP